MVQVRLLTALAGPTGSLAEGDVYSCDEGTAGRLIASRQAVPLTIGGVETSMGEGVEAAVRPRARARAKVRGRV